MQTESYGKSYVRESTLLIGQEIMTRAIIWSYDKIF